MPVEESVGASSRAVEALFPPNALAGPRYASAMQAPIDTETPAGEERA
ncbi:MAG: hypothetical protein OSB00_02805 [Sphingomonas bacterium]|nr:hypothetical protein [Sphingomonas bacterium]